MARPMAVEYDRRILVKRAQMQALHNKYVRAMNAGKREIEKIAMEYFDKQAMYKKVLAGIGITKKGFSLSIPGYSAKVNSGDMATWAKNRGKGLVSGFFGRPLPAFQKGKTAPSAPVTQRSQPQPQPAPGPVAQPAAARWVTPSFLVR